MLGVSIDALGQKAERIRIFHIAMKNKFARLHLLYFLLIVGTAVFLCGMVVFYIHWSLWNIDDEFKVDASSARNHIRDQLAQNETVLIGLGSFLKGRESLDIAALDAYASVMMQRFPHISMFQIAQYIDSQSASSYQQVMLQQGIASPVINQFGGDKISLNSPLSVGKLPVIFVSPEASKAVLGLDLSSIDFIRQSLPSAAHSEITISEPIELFEGDKALVMMQSIPPTQTRREAYVSLLLVKQNMLFLKQNIDAKWDVSIRVTPPQGKEFILGALASQVTVNPNSYFLHRVSVADDIQFAHYKITVQLSKNVSWLDINLWKLALLIIVVLMILAVLCIVYWMHFSLEVKRDKHQKVLFNQANYDVLTQLPNRFYFEDAAQRILANAARQEAGVLLLFVDLNGFKAINDKFGHAAGDKVLKEVARALKSALRQSDLAARLGGDEFAVLIEDIQSLTAVLNMIEKIRLALSSLSVEGVPTHQVSGSVGFAYTRQHGYVLPHLLKVADNSMYGEKNYHYGNFHDVT